MSEAKKISDCGLLTPSYAYKPFRYPWAYDFWQQQQRVHWLPEEVPLGEDCKDWATKLNEHEKNLLTHIFRFFTQSDVVFDSILLEASYDRFDVFRKCFYQVKVIFG